jgi:tRNA A-37 threonylcarbamoyl transferase component Bud32
MTAQTFSAEVPGLADLTLIGRGGFSSVYRARQVQFERTVAVKVLDMDLLDERAQRRFVRECKATGQLSAHPNIVTMYDAGVTPAGKPYIVMEYCPHGSLAVRVRDHGPMSAAEVVTVGAKVADALAAAHDAGIIHRDVKPANILITQYGEPALADFGIATTSDASRSLQTEALTVDYAPPEVLKGLEPDARSDLYSLGVTLYTLLTGVPPYRTSAMMPVAQQLLKILHDPVPSISRPDVPPSLAAVIARLMAKEPGERIVDARAVTAALQASIGGPVVPSQAAPVDGDVTRRRADIAPPTVIRQSATAGRESLAPPEPRPVKPRNRRRLVMIAGSAAAVVAAAVVAVVLVAGGSKDKGPAAQPGTSASESASARASVAGPKSSTAVLTALGDALPGITFTTGDCQDNSSDVPGAHAPVGCVGLEGETGKAVGGTADDPDTGTVVVGIYQSAGEAGVQNAVNTVYQRNLPGKSADAAITGVPLSRLIVNLDGEAADAEFFHMYYQVGVNLTTTADGAQVSPQERAWVEDTARKIYQVLSNLR